MHKVVSKPNSQLSETQEIALGGGCGPSRRKGKLLPHTSGLALKVTSYSFKHPLQTLAWPTKWTIFTMHAQLNSHLILPKFESETLNSDKKAWENSGGRKSGWNAPSRILRPNWLLLAGHQPLPDRHWTNVGVFYHYRIHTIGSWRNPTKENNKKMFPFTVYLLCVVS